MLQRMNWYYAHDGQQNGPHPEESLRELAETGVIDPATPVWSEGMEDWRPISEAAPHLLPPTGLHLPASPDPAQAQCAECGVVFPASEMISLQGERICAQCKPVRLQKMREGVGRSSGSTELARFLKVAKAQRGVNLCLLMSVACYVLVFVGAGSKVDHAATSPAGPMMLLSAAGGLGILMVAVLQIIYVYRLASSLQTGAPILWILGILLLSCIGLILLLVLSSKATKQLREAGFRVGLLGANPKEIERRMTSAGPLRVSV